MPVQTQGSIASELILIGFAGGAHLIYVHTGIRRIHRESGPKVNANVRWNILIPIIAYVGVVLASWELTLQVNSGMTILAASILLLLFITIHNAWHSTVEIASRQPS
jgi:fatty acid desaturase